MKYFLLLLMRVNFTVRAVSGTGQFLRHYQYQLQSRRESFTLKVFYNLGSMFVGAGEATFTSKLKSITAKMLIM